MATENHLPSIPELRKFGLIMFTILGCGFGAAFPFLSGKPVRPLLLTIGLAFGVVGSLAPAFLGPVFELWMKIGNALGWVNSRLILSTVYYVLVVPYGLVLRLRGSDPMHREWEEKVSTYRIPTTTNPNDIKRMEKPY